MSAESGTRTRSLPWAILLPALAFGLSPNASAGQEPTPPHVVVMRNGDRFQATVTEFDSDKGLTLTYPDALEPVRLRLNAVRTVAVLASSSPESLPSQAVITLSDGDSLPADITSFDGKTIGVAIPWAGGKHETKWEDVRRILFADSSSRRIFSGPLPSQDWKFTGRRQNNRNGEFPEASDKAISRNWRIDQNAILARESGSASVPVDLPDKVCVEFDLEWTGQLNFSIGLFSDSFLPADADKPDGPKIIDTAINQGNPTPVREAVSFDINPYNVMLKSVAARQAPDMVGNAQMPPELRSASNAHLTLRADRIAGSYGVWYGDKLISKWEETGEFTGKGKAISFWQHHNDGSLAIRRIVVKNWNGKFDDAMPRGETGRDVLIATDGSRLTGQLLALKDNRWNIISKVGDISIPQSEVLHIIRAEPATETESPESDEDAEAKKKPAPAAQQTSSNGTNSAAAPNKLACISLLGGQAFHLDKISLSSTGTLTGLHPVLGSMTFSFSNVDGIVFPSSSPDQP